MAKRFYGDKINFKSLSCAPVNEHGVVYLFGVLHDAFDFKIESIQAGFPDCIARRQVRKDKWEEIRIEFEFESKSFVAHKHDVKGVDIIICWKHTWKECPKDIEVIELSSMIEDVEHINKSFKDKTINLTDYQNFCREKRLQGLTFKEIAPLWNKKRKENKKEPEFINNKNLTPYKQFLKEKIAEGLSFKEATILWRDKKNKN